MSNKPTIFYKFQKNEISINGAKKIAYLQKSFENFSIHVMKLCKDDEQSRQGMIRLQEACTWFSRCIANMSAHDVARKKLPPKDTSQEKTEGIILPEEPGHLEEPEDGIGNRLPVIIFKKKKILKNK